MLHKRLAATVMSAALALPATAWAADLTLEIKQITIDAGVLRVAIFDESGWTTNVALAGAEVRVDGATAQVVFGDLTPGTYGIKLYQDVDENGDLNRTIMGIPSEPYGFSNDAPVDFGPPGFADAAFALGDVDASHSITLK